jgi:hypothetical protein
MHYEKHYIYILVNGEKCTGKYSLAYILTLKSVIKTSELTLHVKNYILLHFFSSKIPLKFLKKIN